MNPEFPYDDYLDGKITRRDGMVREIRQADITGDDQKELIVVMQSAGSGGFLSADAFTVAEGKLQQVAIVMGVDPASDIVEAFKAMK